MSSRPNNIRNEDWQMCRNWMVEICGLGGSNDLSLVAQAETLVDFAASLRDGVALCKVANKIRPGVIQKEIVFVGDSRSQFFCMHNIRLFREALGKLGVRESEMFTDQDLFNMENFYKVLVSLSIVSRTDDAQATGAKSWPPNNQRLIEDENIYGHLEDLIASRPRDRGASSHATSSRIVISPTSATPRTVVDGAANLSSAYQDDENEKIYEEYIAGPAKMAAQTAKKGVPTTRKQYAVSELISTEDTYVKHLQKLVNISSQSRTILPEDIWVTMFGGIKIDSLCSLHTGFLEELRIQVDSTVDGKLNLLGIWQQRKNQFLVYTKFVSFAEEAKAAYDRLMKSEDRNRKEQFNEMWKAAGFLSSLKDSLVVPIQRILKYHLLLETIKKDAVDTEEAQNLQQAFDIIKDIQHCVNEAKADSEIITRIRQIQTTIVDMALPQGTTLTDYGRLLMDGEVLIRTHDNVNKSATMPRFVFLFDYVMIICKQMGTKQATYQLRECCYVTNLEVVETSLIGPKGKYQFTFEVKRKSGPSPTDQVANVYVMSVRTESSRRDWISSINQAKKNLRPQGYAENGHHFSYKTFDDPAECCVCGKFLAGMFFQGYECSVEYCRQAAHQCCIESVPIQPDPHPEPSVAVRQYNGSMPEHPRHLPVLRFHVGSIVTVWVKWGEWAYGTCTEQKGWFPLSCVKQTGKRSELVSTPSGPNWWQEMMGHPWFVGIMTKEQAASLLRVQSSGTFIVRVSGPESPQYGEAAISIKYSPDENDLDNTSDPPNTVRHIRVMRILAGNGRYWYALSKDPPSFASLPDLIDFYQRNSLHVVFNELPVCLTRPYCIATAAQNRDSVPTVMSPVTDSRAQRRSVTHGAVNDATVPVRHSQSTFTVKAIFDYPATQQGELSLTKNEEIEVISTNSAALSSSSPDRQEWWTGRNSRGEVGIFPKIYVRP